MNTTIVAEIDNQYSDYATHSTTWGSHQWASHALYSWVKGSGCKASAKVKTERGYTDGKLTRRMAQGL